MSVVFCKKEAKSTDETLDQNKESQDILGKFKTYRLSAESMERKLKEANTIIDQLKDEINTSRTVEKNLRNQISFSQKRLIQLQESLNKLTIISEQQRQNEKTSQTIAEKVQELQVFVNETRDQMQNILNRTSKEMDLLRRNEELKAALKAKESEYNSIKAEMEHLMNENHDLVNEHAKKTETLAEELEKSKLKVAEAKAYCDKTLAIYKKQIEEHEQIIKEYERERKSLLEEFEPPTENKHVESRDINFTWTERTVSINTEKRSNTPPESIKKQEIGIGPTADEKALQDDAEFQFFQSSTYSQIKTFEMKRKNFIYNKNMSQKLRRMENRQKPRLDFLTETQDSSQITETSPGHSTARRLFSTNCNHYIQ